MTYVHKRPHHIRAQRLAISGDAQENWYLCRSIANTEIGSEGTWEEWVQLAEAILREEKKIIAAAQPKPFSSGTESGNK